MQTSANFHFWFQTQDNITYLSFLHPFQHFNDGLFQPAIHGGFGVKAHLHELLHVLIFLKDSRLELVQPPLGFLGAAAEVVHGHVKVIRIPNQHLNGGGGIPRFISVDGSLGNTRNLSELGLGEADPLPERPQSGAYLAHGSRLLHALIVSHFVASVNPYSELYDRLIDGLMWAVGP